MSKFNLFATTMTKTTTTTAMKIWCSEIAFFTAYTRTMLELSRASRCSVFFLDQLLWCTLPVCVKKRAHPKSDSIICNDVQRCAMLNARMVYGTMWTLEIVIMTMNGIPRNHNYWDINIYLEREFIISVVMLLVENGGHHLALMALCERETHWYVQWLC